MPREPSRPQRGVGPENQAFGDVLSRSFESIRPLGRGSSGMVHLAKRLGDGEGFVAIKRLNQYAAELPEARARVLREASVLKELEHPGIVSVEDVGLDGDVPYIIEGYVEGETLNEVLGRSPRLDVKEALMIASQTAHALAYAHAKGVVHRDLAPSNIICRPDGGITVVDFGLAKTERQRTAVTKMGEIVGTPLYMAPEQLRSEPPAASMDVYALGTILFEMVTGRPPFSGEGQEFLRAKLLDPPPSLAESAIEGLPPQLVALVDECLSTEPGMRPADGTALFLRLQAVAEELGLELPPLLPADHATAPSPAMALSIRTILIIVGGVILTALAILTIAR